MMRKLMTGWTIPRAMYLLIGGYIFIYSMLQMEWLGIVFGGYFAAMGLFGFGCAAGNCYPMTRNPPPAEKQDFDFEEIKE